MLDSEIDSKSSGEHWIRYDTRVMIGLIMHSARLMMVFRMTLFWFLLASVIFPIAATAAEKRYTVKKNDTLTEIARRQGVSVAALMQLNGLKEPNQIYIGKVLRIAIPDRRPAAKRPTLDPALLKLLDETRITRKKWKYIVIHHSATESGSAKGMDLYHRQERHMENGLAYHFVIGNGKGMGDGEVVIGQRWTDQIRGGHLASESLNEQSVGICLVGNFDDNKPTQKQMNHLHALVDYLMRGCGLSGAAIKTHQQINPIHTRCPGTKFPVKTFLKELPAPKKKAA